MVFYFGNVSIPESPCSYGVGLVHQDDLTFLNLLTIFFLLVTVWGITIPVMSHLMTSQMFSNRSRSRGSVCRVFWSVYIRGRRRGLRFSLTTIPVDFVRIIFILLVAKLYRSLAILKETEFSFDVLGILLHVFSMDGSFAWWPYSMIGNGSLSFDINCL